MSPLVAGLVYCVALVCTLSAALILVAVVMEISVRLFRSFRPLDRPRPQHLTYQEWEDKCGH
jgi:hypothetical protein